MGDIRYHLPEARVETNNRVTYGNKIPRDYIPDTLIEDAGA
jgi:hypothetical protein